MSKEIYISSTPHETRLAIVEDDALTGNLLRARGTKYTLAGSIYNGRVTLRPPRQRNLVSWTLASNATHSSTLLISWKKRRIQRSLIPPRMAITRLVPLASSTGNPQSAYGRRTPAERSERGDRGGRGRRGGRDRDRRRRPAPIRLVGQGGDRTPHRCAASHQPKPPPSPHLR